MRILRPQRLPGALAVGVVAAVSMTACGAGGVAGGGQTPRNHVVQATTTSASRPPVAYVVNSDTTFNHFAVYPVDTSTNVPGKPIPVGYDPGPIAATPNGQAVYVLQFASSSSVEGQVVPIDTTTNRASKPIAVGSYPQALVITPDGRTVYVLDAGPLTGEAPEGEVTPISTATDTAGKPIPVGVHPGAMTITPDGKTLYVVNGDGTITPIATSTNKAGAPIRFADTSESGPIAITPNGATIYVGSTARSGATSIVTPITLKTDAVGRPIKVGVDPRAIVVTPNSAMVYVVSWSGTVTPIATATNSAGKAVSVGLEPGAIAVTPNGASVYVGGGGLPGIGENPVTVIDAATGKIVKDIPIADQEVVTSFAVTPNGKTIYAVTFGNVIPISTATNTAGKPISVGNAPHAITIAP